MYKNKLINPSNVKTPQDNQKMKKYAMMTTPSSDVTKSK